MSTIERTRQKPIHWLLMSLLLSSLLVLSGCGDDDGGGDKNNNTNQNTNLNNNTNAPPLEVVEISPEDGAAEVPIDETIRVTFSRELDPATVDATSVRVSSDGVDAVGRVITNRQAVLFSPAELTPNAPYMLTITQDVTDASGVGLAEDYSSTFTTGATTVDASGPVGDDAVDRIRDPFIFLTRKVELVLVGVDHNNTTKNAFALDPLDFNDMTPAPEEPIPWSKNVSAFDDGDRKLGAAGNLDDDLFDEVVLLAQSMNSQLQGARGHLYVLDFDSADYDPENVSEISADLSLPGSAGPRQYDLTLADVDEDPWSEIVVVGVDDSGNARLWVFDDRLANHAELKETELGGSNWPSVETVWVEAGNIDDDQATEVMVTVQPEGSGDGKVRFFDDVLTEGFGDVDAYGSFVLSRESIGLLNNQSEVVQCDVTMGDVDGDGQMDIVEACREVLDTANDCQVQVYMHVWRLGANGLEQLGQGSTFGGIQSECIGHMPPTFEVFAVDIDGDTEKEILADGHLFDYAPQVASSFNRLTEAVLPYGDDSETAPQDLSVGDINGDGIKDIMVLHRNGSVQVWGNERVQVGWDMDMNPIYETEWKHLDEQDRSGPLSQQNGILVPANLDLDSQVVSPERDPNASDPLSSVKKEVTFSDDRIVAVLAAPPCADGIGQNTGSCKTGIAHSEGGSTSTGTSFSVSAGISVGVEVQNVALFITVASFSAKVAVSAEWSTSTHVTRGVKKTVSNFAAHGEDLVVFYTVPQQRYTYTVSSHPDSSVEGTKLYVNVPMRPRLFSVTRSFYNEHNGGQPDIDTSVLPVVPGDLSSYPSLAEAQDILNAHEGLGITTPPESVNEGAGYKSIELAFFEEVSEEEAVTVSTEAEVEFCGATVCVGAMFGTSGAVYSTSTYSTSTMFTGSVGAIDAEHWSENLYDFGLFAYLYRMSDVYGNPAQTFTVVNYYVD